MNNLNKTKTYLAGAMDRVADGGFGWRDKLTPLLENMGIQVLNPCRQPIRNVTENEDTRARINYYKETGQYEKIKKEYSKIRNADLRCIDISDFIICHVDISVHMCGSYEEIVTANRQKKPILIWCEQGKNQAPNWLFLMLPHEHIFSNMNQLVEHLSSIHMDDSLIKSNRWLFLQDF